MQLTLYTDYSLRTLIFLDLLQEGRTATISEIAEYYGISRNHLVKVVHNLAQKGYITSTRGKGGGVRLSRPGNQINVADVVRDTEPNFHIVECFNPEAEECSVKPICALVPILADATSQFLNVLRKYTIADLLTKKPEWAPMEFIKKR